MRHASKGTPLYIVWAECALVVLAVVQIVPRWIRLTVKINTSDAVDWIGPLFLILNILYYYTYQDLGSRSRMLLHSIQEI